MVGPRHDRVPRSLGGRATSRSSRKPRSWSLRNGVTTVFDTYNALEPVLAAA